MDHKANTLIDELGGTTAVARLCQVRPPSVAEWRQRGIPHARLMYLQALAHVRPDLAAALEAAGYRRTPDASATPDKRAA